MAAPIWGRLNTTIHFLLWVWSAAIIAWGSLEARDRAFAMPNAGEVVLRNTDGWVFVATPQAAVEELKLGAQKVDVDAWVESKREERVQFLAFMALFLFAPWIVWKWLEWLIAPRYAEHH